MYSGVNLSDHRPISLCIDCSKFGPQYMPNNNGTGGKIKMKQFKIRWDKASLADYYNLSNAYLSSSNYDCFCLDNGADCKHSSIHRAAINEHYQHIVHALQSAERVTVPCIPHSALKPFWNEHLDNLKQKSILWHSIWINAGRPLS
jgi:hypothetical protein